MATSSAKNVRAAPRATMRHTIGPPANSEFNHFIMPKLGIRFPRQISYDRWLIIGRQLAAASSSSSWCLGDWLVHGADAYSGRYREAVEQTCLDYQTLRNYAWVARSIELSRRRDALSFAHHAEVAGLPEHEQDFWLRKAEESHWSRNRLRREVRASLAERTTPDSCPNSDAARASRGDDHDQNAENGGKNAIRVGLSLAGTVLSSEPSVLGVPIQVKLSPEQLKFCQVAARRVGRSVEEWAASVLDQAARSELEFPLKRA